MLVFDEGVPHGRSRSVTFVAFAVVGPLLLCSGAIFVLFYYFCRRFLFYHTVRCFFSPSFNVPHTAVNTSRVTRTARKITHGIPAVSKVLHNSDRSRSRSTTAVDYILRSTCGCEILCIICIVHVQPRKHAIDQADHTAPTRQHEIDHADHTNHTDQGYVCPELQQYLRYKS